jgi:hypothetical protein
MNTDQVQGTDKVQKKSDEPSSSDLSQKQDSDKQLQGAEKEKAKENIDVLNP